MPFPRFFLYVAAFGLLFAHSAHAIDIRARQEDDTRLSVCVLGEGSVKMSGAFGIAIKVINGDGFDSRKENLFVREFDDDYLPKEACLDIKTNERLNKIDIKIELGKCTPDSCIAVSKIFTFRNLKNGQPILIKWNI